MQAAERAKTLVKQIVGFSRDDEVDSESYDILENIRNAMELVRSTVPSTIRLKEWLDEDVGRVYGNAAEMATVLMNLISNSVDALAGKTGELEVALSRIEINPVLAEMIHSIEPGIYARLTIRDTGNGMDDATLGRIFDPFFTTKEVGEGTGLGLSTAYAMVSRAGGTIKVASRLGAETTVDVYLPLADNEAARPASVSLEVEARQHLH